MEAALRRKKEEITPPLQPSKDAGYRAVTITLPKKKKTHFISVI